LYQARSKPEQGHLTPNCENTLEAAEIALSATAQPTAPAVISCAVGIVDHLHGRERRREVLADQLIPSEVESDQFAPLFVRHRSVDSPELA